MIRKIGKIRKTVACTLFLGAPIAGVTVACNRLTPTHASSRPVLYWEDPMHPAYRSSQPGTAPDCGMRLVPVYADASRAAGGAASPATSGTARVDGATRQLYGIRVEKVEQSPSGATLRLYGRVAADETRIYRVNLGTEGYVKETSNDAVGNHVAKNQHLAVIYSPDFLAIAGGYLSANERTPGGSTKDNASQSLNTASAQARADRLRNLGMSDVQIDEITSSHKIPEDIYVVAPSDGFILARDISPGMRFEKHAELYQIADLSRVWILAEVFGADAQAFRPGATAQVTLPDTGESFTAHVSKSLPEIDPVTHALKQRLELANPGFRLRPGMFVDISVTSPGHAGLTVPADAILNSGSTKRVFVEVAEGQYQAREVQTGWSSGDRVQVVRGLREGETVVTSGTFLIDSETRLRSPAMSN